MKYVKITKTMLLGIILFYIGSILEMVSNYRTIFFDIWLLLAIIFSALIIFVLVNNIIYNKHSSIK